MKFEEALSNLVDRKLVARESWADKYLVFMPGMQSIWQILTVPTPNAGNWLPLVDDLQAEDWKVV